MPRRGSVGGSDDEALRGSRRGTLRSFGTAAPRRRAYNAAAGPVWLALMEPNRGASTYPHTAAARPDLHLDVAIDCRPDGFEVLGAGRVSAPDLESRSRQRDDDPRALSVPVGEAR